MVAVPVLLGSLMRIPLGWLTDRLGGRRVFTALMVFTPLPLIALALFHDSLGAILAFGFLLGFAGASFAVGVPFVNGWYPPERQGFALGIYGMGMGGTVLAGLTAPRIVDHWGLAAPFWVATGLMVAMAGVFLVLAHDAPRPPRTGPAPGMFAALSVFRTSGRAWALTLFYFMAFGGFVAMFLYLPKLLTGVHDLTKADAGARAAGFALLAVIGRPVGGSLSDRVGAARVLLVSFIGVAVLATLLAATYTSMVPLTICLPDHGRRPRARHRRGLQARARVVPRPRRRGHRRRRRRRRTRRLLPPARHGHRQVGHRRLRARIHPDGARRRRLPVRARRAARPCAHRPLATHRPHEPLKGRTGDERRAVAGNQ